MTLVLDGLVKRFGHVTALDGISFSVDRGAMLGFLGANGAGKTTTMRIVPIDSPLVVVLSYVPLFSPYLMLTRVGMGVAQPLEVAVAIGLLLIAIPAALWLAARLYRAGVLMYGQPPSPRTLLRALRG